MNKPLKGIVVAELGTSIAAPYATWILGNLGATVVKIERPGQGDTARNWGDRYHNGASLWFHSINADKKSVTVDLKDPDELDTLRRWIVAEAHVVVQNFKPGNVQKLGLDANTLLPGKPELIYANIGAFGRTGPLKDKPGYDPLMQAFGGPMSITGHPGQPPVRTGFSAIDQGTGMWCALGILAALNRRHATGKGGEIDTALFETAVAWTNIVASTPLNGGEVPGAYGSGVGGIVPYQAFECSDGWLVLGCGTDRAFNRFCDIAGHPEWRDDERFFNNPARVKHRAEIIALISDVMITQTRQWWSEKLDAAGIPQAPIQDIGEVIDHPQTRSLGMTAKLADDLKLFALPLSIDGERPEIRNGAPALGADTDDILGAYRGRSDP